ncbi:MAG: methyltransferase domain-containing protein [Planctomycetes bacterium]|nr:methyltransferase domain-containing protein [Planctomycetota bacterium]
MTRAQWADVRRILSAYVRRGDPAIAARDVLLACPDVAIAQAAIGEARERSRSATTRAALGRLSRLMRAHAAGCERIARMLRAEVDHDRPLPSVDEGIAFCRKLFDWSVRQNPESSVALCSLGSPRLLARVTHEIVAAFAQWGVLGRDRDTLEIGCGIGRMQVALSGRVRSAHGIDLSAGMVRAARKRCAHLGNVHIQTTSGRDLARYADRSLDLVYAVDSFPYLVQSGMALVETHLREAARVLRPGGDLVILNFSYRSDAAKDRRIVRALAKRHGFAVVRCGDKPFAHWDGEAFHLRKAARPLND